MVTLAALQNGHTETVLLLHELRADVRAAAATGLTAVMLAAQVTLQSIPLPTVNCRMPLFLSWQESNAVNNFAFSAACQIPV